MALCFSSQRLQQIHLSKPVNRPKVQTPGCLCLDLQVLKIVCHFLEYQFICELRPTRMHRPAHNPCFESGEQLDEWNIQGDTGLVDGCFSQ